jgi:putative transposase
VIGLARIPYGKDSALAWVERGYHRTRHDALGMSPLERYLAGPDVARASPSAAALRSAFRAQTTRTQRRSDGTCTLGGQRFEVPSRYRHLTRLTVRYARWDRSHLELLDPNSLETVATLYPLDKAANAERGRRALEPVNAPTPSTTASSIAPLLAELMAQYAATGLPPAYLPFDPEEHRP